MANRQTKNGAAGFRLLLNRVREKDCVTLDCIVVPRNYDLPEKLYKASIIGSMPTITRLNAYIQEHDQPHPLSRP